MHASVALIRGVIQIQPRTPDPQSTDALRVL